MASEGFLLCVREIMKMSPDDLDHLQGVVLAAMETKGLTQTARPPAIDFPDLVKKAMALLHSSAELTGWEMALLAGAVVQYGGFNAAGAVEADIESRAITAELRRYTPRNIANITSVTDSLRERGLIDESDAGAREKGAHRSFRINYKGQQEVLKIWGRFEKSLAA